MRCRNILKFRERSPQPLVVLIRNSGHSMMARWRLDGDMQRQAMTPGTHAADRSRRDTPGHALPGVHLLEIPIIGNLETALPARDVKFHGRDLAFFHIIIEIHRQRIKYALVYG